MTHTSSFVSALIVLGLAAASGAQANPVTKVFTCAAGPACTPARIPDSNGTTDGLVSFTFQVPTGVCPGTTVTYGAHVEIKHANIGDLRVTLIDPTNQRVNVVENPRVSGGVVGSCAGDDISATFTDAAAAGSCLTTIPALSGNVHSAAPLLVYGSTFKPGTWQIEVADQAAGGDGYVYDASLLAICGYTDTIFNDGFEFH